MKYVYGFILIAVMLFIYSTSSAQETETPIQSTQPDGYLAIDSTGEGSPVLVLHAWWGLNDFMKSFCDRLTDSGFVAFAPDLYEGKIATIIPRAESLAGALDSNADAAKSKIAEAVKYLLERSGQSDGKVTVIGFSLGAYYAMDLSAADPEHIDRAVVFYGMGPADFGKSKASYLCHFAEKDPYTTQENIDWLKNTLKKAGRPATFYQYPNTGHWFFESGRPDAYNEGAAELAWERTLAFLKQSPAR
jgi:carboxymethylenebutenolidase